MSKVYLAEKTALDAHTGNGNIHVTQAEKTKIANALTAASVVPATGADLTKLIATIGGVQIFAPEGGGGGGGLTGHTLTFVNDETDHPGATGFRVYIQKADGTQEMFRHTLNPRSSLQIPGVVFFILRGFSFDVEGEIWFNDVQMYYGGAGGQETYVGTYDGNSSVLTADLTVKLRSRPCLLKGTKITLADRSVKNIEDITYEDELLVWDFDNGCLSSAKPAWIKKREESDYYFRNRYASGRELFTTGKSKAGYGHRHYDMTRNEFRCTPTTVGDDVFTLSGTDRHVSCELICGNCEYYNIITARHFNLFANGILTSCSLNNFRKMRGMKFVGGPGSIKFSEFKGFVDADEQTAKRYFDELRIGEMCADKVADLGAYVTNLIRRAV